MPNELTNEQDAINTLHERLLFLEMIICRLYDRADISADMHSLRRMLCEKGLIHGWMPQEPVFRVDDETP